MYLTSPSSSSTRCEKQWQTHTHTQTMRSWWLSWFLSPHTELDFYVHSQWRGSLNVFSEKLDSSEKYTAGILQLCGDLCDSWVSPVISGKQVYSNIKHRGSKWWRKTNGLCSDWEHVFVILETPALYCNWTFLFTIVHEFVQTPNKKTMYDLFVMCTVNMTCFSQKQSGTFSS